MKKGRREPIALVVLVGLIAFGTLFVAPRLMTPEGPNEDVVALAPGSAEQADSTADEDAGSGPASLTSEAEGARPEPVSEPEQAGLNEPDASRLPNAEDDRHDQDQQSGDAATEGETDALADADTEAEGPIQDPASADQSAAAEADRDEQEVALATNERQNQVEQQKPAFDILRVEPDGSTVIAGRAEPGRRLDVMNGDEVLASAEVSPSGDFAAVFDRPLAPGDYQLKLRTGGNGSPDVMSDEVATISIPQNSDGQLLALVTRPGEASRIVNMPSAPAEQADPDPVQAEDPDAAPRPDNDVRQQAALDTDREAVPEGTASAPSVAPAAPIAASDGPGDDTAADAPEREAAPKETARLSTQDDESVEDAADGVVRIEAVEVENDRLFVAGSASGGDEVRVFANGERVGSDQVGSDGRFLVEARRPLPVGENRIHADLVRDGRVIARALVPFIRPEAEMAAAVAPAPPQAEIDEASPRSSAQEPRQGAGLDAGAEIAAPPTVEQAALTPADASSVIIRRGDTLWQISRRIYGQGVRYTTIYMANRPQIQDPDLIQPGQIFAVPDEALDNAEELHRNLRD